MAQVNPVKRQPNRGRYLQTLARMTASEKAAKVFELSDAANQRFREGLRLRFPKMSEADRHVIFLQRLAACHNRNY